MRLRQITLRPPVRQRRATLAIASIVLAFSFAGAARGQVFTFDQDAPVDYRIWNSRVFALAVGDVNGDRLDDMVAIHAQITNEPPYWGDAKLEVYLQQPNGTLAVSFDLQVTGDTAALSVGIGDFNEDGISDIAVGQGPGILMLLADGNGGFAARPYSTVTTRTSSRS